MRLLLDECMPRGQRRDLVVLAIHARSNDINDLRPLVPQILVALQQVVPGTVVRIPP